MGLRSWLRDKFNPVQPGPVFDPDAPKHPDCVLCQDGWAVHTDKAANKRYHLDVFAAPEYGVMYECPCTKWTEDEDEANEEWG